MVLKMKYKMFFELVLFLEAMSDLLIVVGSAIEAKMWKNGSGLWQCLDCNHTCQQPTNMRNHIESKHVFTDGYYCQQCNKFCRTKNALSIHRTRYKH